MLLKIRIKPHILYQFYFIHIFATHTNTQVHMWHCRKPNCHSFSLFLPSRHFSFSLFSFLKQNVTKDQRHYKPMALMWKNTLDTHYFLHANTHTTSKSIMFFALSLRDSTWQMPFAEGSWRRGFLHRRNRCLRESKCPPLWHRALHLPSLSHFCHLHYTPLSLHIVYFSSHKGVDVSLCKVCVCVFGETNMDM